MKKDVLKIKVYEQSRHNYKPTPTIMLKGLWLEKLGFGAGTLLTVRCEEGMRESVWRIWWRASGSMGS